MTPERIDGERRVVFPSLDDFKINQNHIYIFDNYGGRFDIPSPVTLNDLRSLNNDCVVYAYQLTGKGKRFASLDIFTGPTGVGKDTVTKLTITDKRNFVTELSQRLLSMRYSNWEKERDRLLSSGKIVVADPLFPFPNEELIKIQPGFEEGLVSRIKKGGIVTAQKPSGTYFYDELDNKGITVRSFGESTIPDLIHGRRAFSQVSNKDFVWSMLVGIIPSPQITMVWNLYRSLLQTYGDDYESVNRDIQPAFKKMDIENITRLREAQAGGGMRGINRTLEAIHEVANYLWSQNVFNPKNVSGATWNISRIGARNITDKDILHFANDEMLNEVEQYVHFVTENKKYHDALLARGVLTLVLQEVLIISYQSEFLIGYFEPQKEMKNRPLLTLIATNAPDMSEYEDVAALMRCAFNRKEDLLSLLLRDVA